MTVEETNAAAGDVPNGSRDGAPNRARDRAPNAAAADRSARAVGVGRALDANRAAVDTRARFVREILVRVPRERVVELHLFAPIRQAGVESGVAVVAAMPDVGVERAGATDDATPAMVMVTALDEPVPEETALEETALEETVLDAVPVAPVRHTVYTARYRLTLKGPDRGRWQLDVREEADAPLVTVDAVVRGVQQRAGDAGDPTRLDAAAVAALVGA